MTQKQSLLLGLTTDNPQDLADNLSNTDMTLDEVCESRQEYFVGSLSDENKNKLYKNDILQEDVLIALLTDNQFIPEDLELSYAPYLSEQDKINDDSRKYLASTDWYITRFAETGVVVPDDITTARATARTNVII
jgi:hypothetical protein